MSTQLSTEQKAMLVPVATGMVQRQCACGQHTGGAASTACGKGSPDQQLNAAPRAFSEHDFSHVPLQADTQAINLQPLQGSGVSGRLFRTEAEAATSTAADDEARTETGSSLSANAEPQLEGLCLRTPIGPGTVRFSACSADQLNDFAVIPESGTVTFTPVSGVRSDSDGFWYRHRTPKTDWFKVGDHCDLEVSCGSQGFSYSSCCNFAASLFQGRPGWSSATHGSTNPF